MTRKSIQLLRNPIPYTAAFTREQFLFYETRATARLISEGLSEEEAVNRIIEENLFQYPTEKSVRRIARACVRRLKAMEDETLVQALASEPSQTAKQICLYAMMRQYRVVWDFMVTVIGEKYRLRDISFGKMDLNVFFIRLQEQDDNAASWSDSTVTKLKQVLTKILVENGYIDSGKAGHLNPVWLDPILENAIRDSGDHRALAAFNCFS
ncbi:MAG: DUF1819 family protein [Hungatella sp.]|jgi:hypothetical protein|nr:DUF1819 family protein [Hungatella sp.]